MQPSTQAFVGEGKYSERKENAWVLETHLATEAKTDVVYTPKCKNVVV